MDAVVQGYPTSMESLKFNPNYHSIGMTTYTQSAYRVDEDLAILSSGIDPGSVSDGGGDTVEEGDYTDYAVLKYINQMLMEEEDLERKPCMFHDCSALQATEKSFYDVLLHKYPPPPPPLPLPTTELLSLGSIDIQEDDNSWISGSHCSSSSSSSNDFRNQIQYEFNRPFNPISPSNSQILDCSSNVQSLGQCLPRNYQLPNILNFVLDAGEAKEEVPGGKRNNLRREESEEEARRSNKQLASYSEDLASEMFDKVLLLSPDEIFCGHPESAPENEEKNKTEQPKGPKRGRPRGKKQGVEKGMVDLRNLLTQCAQAVGSYDSRTAGELLKKIRLHSSPTGDGTERLAHYFADALEARLFGTGTALYTAFAARKISAADILKAYQVYVASCPFKIMSNIFANKSIKKAAKGASTLHIIDFGILYGFQWPCLIQGLSMRPGGPPKLRITGIDLPQPGFRPEGRVEETGRRLESYCRRFNVPYEYHAVAKKWETIQIGDLKIKKDEIVAVNCLYRLGSVPDETVVADSPRDSVLKLIRSINPDIFIHGIINGTFNAPFFVTRFREALFHFSAMFDAFDATAPREDEERIMFEREIFARDAMNVIACEGTQRIERPETYKQWGMRNGRAGLTQMPLDTEVVKFVRNKVKLRYHRDFMVDEDDDGKWMLQGWKGRVIFALSCWKSTTSMS